MSVRENTAFFVALGLTAIGTPQNWFITDNLITFTASQHDLSADAVPSAVRVAINTTCLAVYFARNVWLKNKPLTSLIAHPCRFFKAEAFKASTRTQEAAALPLALFYAVVSAYCTYAGWASMIPSKEISIALAIPTALLDFAFTYESMLRVCVERRPRKKQARRRGDYKRIATNPSGVCCFC